MVSLANNSEISPMTTPNTVMMMIAVERLNAADRKAAIVVPNEPPRAPKLWAKP
jgi:hypothetical protein